ncbi:MAG TPA: BON domain-containing protein [Terriglobales bacterium]|nr:BON domain-containing protein [Terriglobales bacterium]
MLIAPAFLAAFLVVQAPQPKPSHTHATHATHAAVEHPQPKGPKTEAELQQDLTAALRAAPLSGDKVELVISGKDITLKGEVHSAEHKGLATREARKVAAQDGWTSVHVLNQLAVQLPPV